MSGGYLNISKEIIENIPIAINEDEQLTKLSQAMNASPSEAKLAEINRVVYELYGLTKDEIKIVEGGQDVS